MNLADVVALQFLALGRLGRLFGRSVAFHHLSQKKMRKLSLAVRNQSIEIEEIDS